MIRALFRKQLLEVFTWLYQDNKTGKKRQGGKLILFVGLYVFLFLYLGVVFFLFASMLCGPLVSSGVCWLYGSIMGLIGVFMGVIGSVFSTYSSLYRAKDNDLLLSMPIPPLYILLARLSGVYVTGLLYELLVMLPAYILWFLLVPVSVSGILCAILYPILLSFLVLSLSAILGYIVAVIASHVRHKTAVTVVVSVVLIVTYFLGYSKLYPLILHFADDLPAFGASIDHGANPLVLLGRAATGHIPSLLLCLLVSLLVLAGVFYLLRRSFLTITTKTGSGKTGRTKAAKVEGVRSLSKALLHRELRRFTSHANYMMNCGLGTLLMPIGAVGLLIKGEALLEMVDGMGAGRYAALLVAAILCLAISMNDMTACSLSLEGDTLWLLQSLPVPTTAVLVAKLRLQLWLTLPPAVLLLLVFAFALKLSIGEGILLVIVAGLFSLLVATAGLALDLRLPNLHWTNDIVVIKQGLPVMCTLLGGWVCVGILAVGYVALSGLVSPMGYLGIVCGVLAVVCGVLLRWLMTKGAERFARLA